MIFNFLLGEGGKMPTFKTIRQTAATGLLPEHRLRIMQKQGHLPGIQAGNRFMVNVDALAEQLERESRRMVEATEGGNHGQEQADEGHL